jgi:hypothetical protein
MEMKKELIAVCGMNCRICVGYFGYTMAGMKRKHICPGCRISDKNCAFIKKHCAKASKKEVNYCFECDDFPCELLEKLDKRYREEYKMSMIDNLNFIKENGIDEFLKLQEEKYKCDECDGVICVHTGKCYECGSSRPRLNG